MSPKLVISLAVSLAAAVSLTAQTPTRPQFPPPDRNLDTAPLPSERPSPRRGRAAAPAAAAPLAVADPCAGKPPTGACAFARADLSSLRRAGSWSWDWPDGAGNDVSYGGDAIGFSEDGRYLYISCHPTAPKRGIAKFLIPSQYGQRLQVVAPCAGPTYADIEKILPGGGGGAARIGGVLEQGGRVVVSAYWTYDANGQTIASHWAGPSLTNLAGPFAGTVSPGLVKSQMGPVPPEWRALLGGPAFATAGYTSIISRQSYGAALTTFDPATVTANGFPMSMLLGCPHSVPACRTWISWGPSSPGFEGSELSGGAFIVPGTRTLVVSEREGRGSLTVGGTVPHEGYGYTTRIPAEHGTPHPGPENVLKIFSLSDPDFQKGNKAYPYYHALKLYDLAELAEVKAGTQQASNVKPYAVIEAPAFAPGDTILSAAFDPVSCRFALVKGTGGGVNSLDVFEGIGCGSTAPPAPTGTITASPLSITAGGHVTISGTLHNATTATVTPRIGTVSGPSWSVVDAPTVPTTYTVTATTTGGTFSASVSVDVTPSPVDCVGTWRGEQRVPGSETACLKYRRDYTLEDVFTVTIPPSNGGAACPASPVRRVLSEACAIAFPLQCSAAPTASGTEIDVTCTGAPGDPVSSVRVTVPPPQ